MTPVVIITAICSVTSNTGCVLCPIRSKGNNPLPSISPLEAASTLAVLVDVCWDPCAVVATKMQSGMDKASTVAAALRTLLAWGLMPREKDKALKTVTSLIAASASATGFELARNLAGYNRLPSLWSPWWDSWSTRPTIIARRCSAYRLSSIVKKPFCAFLISAATVIMRLERSGNAEALPVFEDEHSVDCEDGRGSDLGLEEAMSSHFPISMCLPYEFLVKRCTRSDGREQHRKLIGSYDTIMAPLIFSAQNYIFPEI